MFKRGDKKPIDPHKRMTRLFTITWLLIMLLLIALVFMLMRAPDTQVNNYIGRKGDTGAQGSQGVQGIPGLQGERGQVGMPGKDAAPAPVPQQTIIEKQIPVQGSKGDKGDQGLQGEQGPAGRSPELRKNDKTGDIEWRLEGDTFWQVLIDKCDIKTCEVK